MAGELSRWEPLEAHEIGNLFRGAPFRWWICGGLALELHLGTSWRLHADSDVGISRSDAEPLWRHLADWSLSVAADGHLHPWHGEPLDPARHHNNVWCRDDPRGPWRLDITIGSGDTHRWHYRRDERISRPWDTAVLQTSAGIPYLAPELQLLFKSKGARPKDHHDALVVIPRLDRRRRAALSRLLPDDHPWQRQARGTDRT